MLGSVNFLVRFWTVYVSSCRSFRLALFWKNFIRDVLLVAPTLPNFFLNSAVVMTLFAGTFTALVKFGVCFDEGRSVGIIFESRTELNTF